MFGELVRAHRWRRAMTQEDLAGQACVSARQIRDLEAGRTLRPRPDTVRLLADALGLTGADRDDFQQAALPAAPANGSGAATPGGPGTARQPACAPSTYWAPAQLPPDIAEFTGRTELLRDLTRLLSSEAGDAPPVAMLSGAGGIGKTTLAVRAAHLLAPLFPDGQLFVDLGGPAGRADPDDVLAGFLVALGMDPIWVAAGGVERSAQFRSLVAGRRILVVLDNAASAAQLRPLLPAGSGCRVLVTCRRRLTSLPGVRLFDVGLLSEHESLRMLAKIIGTERLRAEEEAARRLCGYCAGLAMALRIAGSRLLSRPHWSMERFADACADEQRRLDELAADDRQVRASIGISYLDLATQDAQALLPLAALPVTDIPVWAAAALLQCPIPQAERALESIVDARLLDGMPSGHSAFARYRMHDLVRLFAQGEAEKAGISRAAVVARAGAAWLTLAGYAADALPTGYAVIGHGGAARWAAGELVERAVRADPLGWYDAERAALHALVLAVAAHDLDELAWDLAATATRYYSLRWRTDDWRRTHEAALAVVRRAGNRRGEAHLLRGLGELAMNVDDYGTAVHRLTAAAELFEQLGESRGQAHALLGLGNAQRRSGRTDKAMTTYATVARLSGDLGDRLLDADLAHNLGVAFLQQGRLAEATVGLAKAKRTYEAIADCGGIARALRGLARAHQRLGDHERSIATLHEACHVTTGSGSPRALALALTDLAQACLASGRLTDAEAALTRCMPIYEQVHDPLGLGTALAASAELRLALGDARDATSLIRRSVKVFDSAGISIDREKSRNVLARAQQMLGGAATPASQT